MKTYELIVLSTLLIGISLFGLGIALYVFQLMEKYNVEWQVELAFSGFLLISLALAFSKIMTRVKYYG
ncbi:MAG: hypothetical protein RMI79_03725 [Nitrososphaerota archaeon]|nr:hypothetical protein [Nitrososphaerota archaeon]